MNTAAAIMTSPCMISPFFLFLRHMDPHSPYLAPVPFQDMFFQGDAFDPELSKEIPDLSDNRCRVFVHHKGTSKWKCHFNIFHRCWGADPLSACS